MRGVRVGGGAAVEEEEKKKEKKKIVSVSAPIKNTCDLWQPITNFVIIPYRSKST